MNSIASKAEVVHLGTKLASEIPLELNPGLSGNTQWTQAVYEVLRALAQERQWKIYPEEKPYKGEYLCDFTLFEEGYGCRIACESQWSFGIGDNNAKVDWAFDKLRGVKADIKLFVFEGSDEEWPDMRDAYLRDNAQLSVDESFLILHWKGDRFIKSWWKPNCNGQQDHEIRFTEF
jgi:hypothetical protein